MQEVHRLLQDPKCGDFRNDEYEFAHFKCFVIKNWKVIYSVSDNYAISKDVIEFHAN